MTTNPVKALRSLFFKKIHKTDSCWNYTGRKTRGYGYVSIGAHRYSWILHHGEIPKGNVLCHKCDNPSCVRPDHLFLGTQADNIADMIKKGRDGFRGAKHYNAKLTLEEIENIRKEYSPHRITQDTLAKKYGVTRENIHYIIHGKSWSCQPFGINKKDQRENLTPEQCKEVDSLKGQMTSRQVARNFGVGKSTILRHWRKTIS